MLPIKEPLDDHQKHLLHVAEAERESCMHRTVFHVRWPESCEKAFRDAVKQIKGA